MNVNLLQFEFKLKIFNLKTFLTDTIHHSSHNFEISYLTLKNIYRRISKTTLLFTSFIFGLLSRKDEGMTEKSIEFADWHKHWNKTRTSGVVRNAGLTCSP